VIERHQRRTLPARFDVSGAKIVDHIDAGHSGQRGAIADLPGPVPLRAMQDGLAMKTHQRHLIGRQSRFF